MTNLTDKWKKGELPNGWYWVEGCRAEGIYAYTAEYLNNIYRPRNGEKIIEQVPSYEIWKAVHEQWKVLLEENTKLKELLKECKQWFDWYHIDTGTGKEYIESWHKKGREIHAKISEVLGRRIDD